MPEEHGVISTYQAVIQGYKELLDGLTNLRQELDSTVPKDDKDKLEKEMFQKYLKHHESIFTELYKLASSSYESLKRNLHELINLEILNPLASIKTSTADHEIEQLPRFESMLSQYKSKLQEIEEYLQRYREQ